ncbi:MAG: serine/threonine protein kinase [Gemmatimonadetes bacterium]|nr:serine/threonine protein kinase [Gemmatimonadota bacterium]
MGAARSEHVAGDQEWLERGLEGTYQVLRELGRGASARVFLCRDLRYDRLVALKLLRADLADSVVPDRFQREIDLAARLSHPHILPVLDSGELDGRVYFVMPFVESDSLASRLRADGPLPVDVALRIARGIGEALHHAHQHGVLHRDVKPSNILLTGNVAMLGDFGIATALSRADDEETLTESGTVVGTPHYMSPEQLSGDMPVDPRSDLYSLACVVYEMLTGDPPFTGSSARIIAARQLTQPPAPLTSLRSVSPAVELAVMRGLEKTAADRHESVRDFVDALQADVTQAIVTSGVPRRTLWPVLTLGAAIIAIVLYAIIGPLGTRLDDNRIALFPVVDPSIPGGGGTEAEQLATYLGYVLEGTDPLLWEEGRDWLLARERDDPALLSTARKLQLSRERGVGHMIDGDIIWADSLRVVLRLYNVAEGSLVARRGATGSLEASPAGVAARAVSVLVGDLLGDRPLDVGTLGRAVPSGVAQFHLGEIAFRETRLADALEHYGAALGNDSSFALAALKGALAAQWVHNVGQAEELLEVAQRHRENLPRRFRHLADGISHHVRGEADEAVADLRAGLTIQADWAEGWMALGDVYFELMPSVEPLDSLAKAAYLEARRLDADFKVPLVPLTDYAIWEGQADRASAYLDELEQAGADLLAIPAARVLLACASSGPATVDWSTLVEEEPGEVLSIALSASIRGASLECAEAGARSLLSTATPTNATWGAFLILQSVLAVQERFEELHELMRSPAVAHLPTDMLYLFDAAAGVEVADEARRVAADMIGQGEPLRSSNLWVLGEFQASEGDLAGLTEVVGRLEDVAVDSDQTRDRFFVQVLRAQVAALIDPEGVAALGALEPSGDLLWDLWAGLALERARLAELLLAAGRWGEAERVAREMDSHRSAFHLLLLPRTLAVRAEAAERLGRPDEARALRERLRRLRGRA